MNRTITPLDADRLRASVADARIAIDVLAETDSTNAWLLRLAPNAAHRHAGFAEAQQAGRGRLGRAWRAQTGRHLLLSFGWHFASMPAPGLSLAAGVAVRQVLERAGVADAMLKWPNDIYWRGRKLAGVLVETRVAGDGVCAAIGVGVNVAFGDGEEGAIGVPAADLCSIVGHVPDRNQVGAELVSALHACCETFATDGFDAFRDDWDRYNAHAGQRVRILDGNDSCEGQVLGITANGALRLLLGEGREREFRAGDVSLRTF
jgi:BirA family biotin operon repressor/biotin-[acetyl-CoA-carboxylase] ligase